MKGPTLAAGAIVWRDGSQGVEVVLVHRPKYDDWSFPKGKLDPGEHHLTAAVREVAEETGVQVRLGAPVGVQSYPVSTGTKQVRYWSARPIGDRDIAAYRPNDEVDDVVWVPVPTAHTRLSYRRDAEVLGAFLDLPFRADPLVILRHAHARPRKSWPREDLLRTLGDEGRVQARVLVAMLEAYDVQRVLSSDAVRCTTTVQPFAEETLVELETDHRLSEEATDPVWVAQVLHRLLADSTRAVVCSHRKALPRIWAAIGLDDPALEPGGFLVVHRRGGQIEATEQHTA